MKAIKFLSMAVVAMSIVFLSACGDNQKPDAAFSVFMTDEIVTEGGQEVTNGSTVDVTHLVSNEFQTEMIAHLYIKNNSEAKQSYTIKEIRKFDNVKYPTAMCISTCMPGNSEKEQTWDSFDIENGEAKAFQAHLTIQNDVKAEAAICPLDLEISNGTETFKVTLNFEYTPAAN